MIYTFDITLKNRQLLEGLIDKLSITQLNHIPDGFNNNIIWNIGHSIVTQQLLVYGLSGLDIPISKDMIDTYRKGTRPNGKSKEAEVHAIKSLLFTTLAQLREDYNKGIFKTFKPYTLGTTGGLLTSVEEALEFNNYHEGLHLGYCMALVKALAIK